MLTQCDIPPANQESGNDLSGNLLVHVSQHNENTLDARSSEIVIHANCLAGRSQTLTT